MSIHDNLSEMLKKPESFEILDHVNVDEIDELVRRNLVVIVVKKDCESNILLFLYIVNRIRTYILIISVIYYYCMYLANRHRGMHVAGGVCGVYIYVDKLKNQDKV